MVFNSAFDSLGVPLVWLPATPSSRNSFPLASLGKEGEKFFFKVSFGIFSRVRDAEVVVFVNSRTGS
jgi:hypothetical protein